MCVILAVIIPPLSCYLNVRAILSVALLTGFKSLRSPSRSPSSRRPRHRPASNEAPCLEGNPSAPPHHHLASGGTTCNTQTHTSLLSLYNAVQLCLSVSSTLHTPAVLPIVKTICWVHLFKKTLKLLSWRSFMLENQPKCG